LDDLGDESDDGSSLANGKYFFDDDDDDDDDFASNGDELAFEDELAFDEEVADDNELAVCKFDEAPPPKGLSSPRRRANSVLEIEGGTEGEMTGRS
jgi:hypothetical protein